LNLELEGKIAVVTGGTRGIGFAIAKSLAEEGAVPLLTYVSNDVAASEALKELQVIQPQTKVLKFDVSSEPQVKEVFESFLKQSEKIDILVNNAGITKDNLLARMKEEEWDSVIQVNLKSVFLMSRAVMRPMMKQKGGCIINIASIVAESGNPGQTNYTAAKGGMISFTKSLAREIASRAITVNAITPGYIETDMTAHLPEKTKQVMLAHIPLGRLGRPEDVGNLVSYLASPRAAYITGQVIGINGGLYM